jgi:dihydroorotase
MHRLYYSPPNAWKVQQENIEYKCNWSPFEGTTFNHKVEITFVNGHIVYNKGIFDESKKGQRLTFSR